MHCIKLTFLWYIHYFIENVTTDFKTTLRAGETDESHDLVSQGNPIRAAMNLVSIHPISPACEFDSDPNDRCYRATRLRPFLIILVFFFNV